VSETELVEPSRFPVDEEPAGSAAVNRRSFRETLHLKTAGLWSRRRSSGTWHETAARPPLAAGAAPSGWGFYMTDESVARWTTGNSLSGPGTESDVELSNLDAPLEKRQPPEWSANRLRNPRDIAAAEQQDVNSGHETQPVCMANPPCLNSPPSVAFQSATDRAPGLAISRMEICRQVRGYDDVVKIHPQHLRCGQPILVYAALDNFLSIATARGYRTLTQSTLEIQGRKGDVLLRMPLGTAIDLSEAPRQDFYLTHLITIPENLPAGDYILDLRIDDLSSHETSASQMAVSVMADRTHPDGTGDTLKFATLPDSFQR
jgi:hypothetical protein